MTSKKSQISLEYMLLFSFALLIFIVIGTIVVAGMQRTRSMDSGARYLAKQIKSSIIIASMSQTDFQTSITLPGFISDKKIFVDIYKSPDNYVVIKDGLLEPGGFKYLAREFLPTIDPVGGNLENLSTDTIFIRKQGNNITVSLS